MIKSDKQKGFTLIELLLAMTFIAFLLLFMVTVILQATRLYVKGIAVRQINQTGRQLVEGVGSSLRTGSSPVYIGANHRLCVGGASYAWNLENETVNQYSGADAGSELRFVSVKDPGGIVCSSPDTPIEKKNSVDLAGPEILPLSFSLEKHGRLWDIALVLSTSGENKAEVDSSTPTGFACSPQNQFCAFGDFETSVYARGGE
jgi:prepilin-type N-terminal cleavage/methylation domain-containing protein